MENRSPLRQRVMWFALATFGTLLLLPATRHLVGTQLQMETLTYSTQTDPEAERAVGARLPNDYPVQLALATKNMPREATATTVTDGLAQTKARNRRILALAQRFPEQPSVYANFLRYTGMGEMRVMRDAEIVPPASGTPAPEYRPSDESLALFDAAATKGAQVDPDNAYFPMMRAVGLFNAHRDSEALEALKTASRCSRWTEYYQDEAEGQERLYSLTHGGVGAAQRLNIAASILFPQYAQLRASARIATHMAIQTDLHGNREEAISIRQAVMHCGSLMRTQGRSAITALVGISITNLATSDTPGAIVDVMSHSTTSPLVPLADPDSLLYGNRSKEETTEHRQQRCNAYYTYLEDAGHSPEAAWAKTEIAAADQSKKICKAANSVFDGKSLYGLGLTWIVNIALLSSALILLALGATAHLAGMIRPRKALWVWRSGWVLLVLGGLGLWQWQAAQSGASVFVQALNLFSCLSDSGQGYMDTSGARNVSYLTAGLSLLLPVLFVGLIVGMTLKQRVPLATGLGRGLRGMAMPLAAVVFVLYAASLLPTAYAEAVVNNATVQTLKDEPHYLADSLHQTWPGDPQLYAD